MESNEWSMQEGLLADQQSHEFDMEIELQEMKESTPVDFEVNTALLNQSTPPKPVGRMTELAFLDFCLSCSSKEDLKSHIERRLSYLKVNDDASKFHQLPFYKIAMYRSPAIFLTLILELLVGLIVSRHNAVLEKHILLAAFIPVLSSVSGTIGLQASTATLRALATGHTSTSTKSIMKLIFKELKSAAIISCVSGGILALISGGFSKSTTFGLVTGSSIVLSSCMGGIIGSLAPMSFKSMGIDPAITAGPFETSLQDQSL